MLIDVSHWLVALLIAVSVHLAGIMWFEPTAGRTAERRELESEKIVVHLGRDSGQVAATAALLDRPEEGGLVEPSEETTDRERANLQQSNTEDVKTSIEEVVAPGAIRSEPDSEVAQDVAALDQEESEVKKPAAANTLLLPADDVEIKEAVVLAPTVSNGSDNGASAPAPLQKQAATEAIFAPLIEDAAELEDSNPVLVQERETSDEETPVKDELEPVQTKPAPSDSIEPQQQIAAVVLEEGIPTLEDVEQVVTSTPSAAVETQPVMPSSVPPTEQVARAITLEELHDISGVSARYAGLLKGWLHENMHYPRAARLAGQEGRAIVRFVIDRSGGVSLIELELSSGHAILDREAVEMIERAAPFPVMPEEMAGTKLELRVPIVFEIRGESLIRQIPPIFLE